MAKRNSPKKGDDQFKPLKDMITKMQESNRLGVGAQDLTSKINYFNETISLYTQFEEQLPQLKTAKKNNKDVIALKKHAKKLYATANNKLRQISSIIEESLKKIDDIMEDYNIKITALGDNLKGRTKTIVKQLYDDLLEYRNTYSNQVRTKPQDAYNEYINKVSNTINSAKKELGKINSVMELGLGNYLTNMLKKLVNAVTKAMASVVTLGKSEYQGFFKEKKTQAYKDVEALEQKITDKESLDPRAGSEPESEPESTNRPRR